VDDKELLIKQVSSAFWSNFSAFILDSEAGITSFTLVVTWVNCVFRSTLPNLPCDSHSIVSHSSFETRAIARNDKTTQFAIEAISNSSGDYRLPGPPKSSGEAISNGGRLSANTVKVFMGSPLTFTLYRWGNGFIEISLIEFIVRSHAILLKLISSQ